MSTIVINLPAQMPNAWCGRKPLHAQLLFKKDSEVLANSSILNGAI
jgi:hypothetical protein